MKMGFMHVSPAEENSPAAEFVKAWSRCIRKTTDLFGVEATFQVARGGLRPDAGRYGYVDVLMETEFLRGYMELEKAGMDAVSVVCMGDQMINAARAAFLPPNS